jgi:hypothetical protein
MTHSSLELVAEAGYFDYPRAAGNAIRSRFLLSKSMMDRLAASGVPDLIKKVSTLRRIRHPLLVYPDASPKPYGFPNGIAIRTEPGWVYPLAAPDMGCGFELIDTGIELEDEISGEQKTVLLSSIIDAVATSSRVRMPAQIDLREILLNGLSAVNEPQHFERLRPSEEGNAWPASWAPLRASDLDALHDSLGAATGHFVAIHVVRAQFAEHAPPVGRLIVVVHIGAAPVRDLLNKMNYLLSLAEWSINAGVIDPESAASGFFPVSLDSVEGRHFIGLAMACRNFGYANRQIVADRVLEILSRIFPDRQLVAPVELRHVDHVAFEDGSESLLTRRGLQPMRTSRPLFIAGGAFSHAYICDTPVIGDPWGNLAPHGNPVLPRSIMGPAVAKAMATGHYMDREYGRDLKSNVPFNEGQYLADTFSLEDQMLYMGAIGWSDIIALLSPIVNFQDMAH